MSWKLYVVLLPSLKPAQLMNMEVCMMETSSELDTFTGLWVTWIKVEGAEKICLTLRQIFIMLGARITYNYGHQQHAFSQLKCHGWHLVCCLILHNCHQAANNFDQFGWRWPTSSIIAKWTKSNDSCISVTSCFEWWVSGVCHVLVFI